MRVTIRNGHSGKHRVVAVSGEIDMATAPRMRDQLIEILHRHCPYLIVDLSEVTFCDSTGLAALVGTARRAELLHGEFVLAAPADPVRKVLDLTGLRHYLRVIPAPDRWA